MNKTKYIIEHAVVTFGEAAVAYYVAASTPKFNWTLVAGAVGAGLSAVYNLVRQSTPTLPVAPAAPTVPPAVPPAPAAV